MNHIYKYKIDPDLFDITKTDDGCIEIYKNDLKHRNNKGIDMKKVIGYDGIDMDTIKYRIDEFKNMNDKKMLDFSDLNLTHIPSLEEKIFYNIRMLFISDNKLNCKLDFRNLKNLLVFDCSSNNLKLLPLLPLDIEEINCRNNEIISIDDFKNHKILRLDISFNKLKHIPIISTLKILTCDNNHITDIHFQPNLETLDCRNNKITKLITYPNLLCLECDNNILDSINPMPKLTHLYCTNNKLISLNYFEELIHINMIDNHVEELPYYPKLKECICSYDKTKRISDKYNVNKEHTMAVNNILSLVFN